MSHLNPVIDRKGFLGAATAVVAAGALAGCSSDGSGSSSDSSSFKIGMIGPLTGAAATYGVSAENGAKLAVKDFSSKKYKFEMKGEDDVADGEKPATAYIISGGKYIAA